MFKIVRAINVGDEIGIDFEIQFVEGPVLNCRASSEAIGDILRSEKLHDQKLLDGFYAVADAIAKVVARKGPPRAGLRLLIRSSDF